MSEIEEYYKTAIKELSIKLNEADIKISLQRRASSNFNRRTADGGENVLQAKETATEDFNTAIKMITKEINRLLNLLWHENEPETPVSDEETDGKLSSEREEVVMKLMEKIGSCFSVTEALKERYNGQKVLISRARERIKSQLQIIDDLKRVNSEEKVR